MPRLWGSGFLLWSRGEAVDQRGGLRCIKAYVAIQQHQNGRALVKQGGIVIERDGMSNVDACQVGFALTLAITYPVTENRSHADDS